MAKQNTGKSVESLVHGEAKRKNIPTAEYQSVLDEEIKNPRRVRYERRNTPWLNELAALHDMGKASPEFQTRINRDLDPQLIWRGKDEQDWSDLIVHAPPLYIQEKVHPKVLIDDLHRQFVAGGQRSVTGHQPLATGHPGQSAQQIDLFSDFNGLPDDASRTEFYQHDAHWSNRMILGDSLQVMASLAEREGLRGKVQCIYLDPPYGIKFNSNFQWSTTSRDVKDGSASHITREPEQVKAFRDTWRDGIHSYLTYLRDRLTVARDLLADSGSVFVQIGDENVHRVRVVMDEVFGDENFVSEIVFQKTGGQPSLHLSSIQDHVLFYAKKIGELKYRQLFQSKELGIGHGSGARYDQVDDNGNTFQLTSLTSNRPPGDFPVTLNGKQYGPSGGYWKTGEEGFRLLIRASRVRLAGRTLRYVRYISDFPAYEITNLWTDTAGSAGKVYVVQTSPAIVQRCLLMTTDPGDLVLDPTCGSGTTAYVAEQWGRRWITIDTSRVALALARARIMGARYPYYVLADEVASVQRLVASNGKELEYKSQTTGHRSLRQGFVYERVPRTTLKSIANNAEIDVIWDKWQQTLEPLREQLNAALGTNWQEWEIPRELDVEAASRRFTNDPQRLEAAATVHAEWWQARIARQKEIDASIAAKAEHEYLYDKPYEDKKIVRVAGPFTVESLSPHRVLAVDENDELIDHLGDSRGSYGEERDFVQIILENLKTAGVQQAHKEDRIAFTSLTPWPGSLVCAVGTYEFSDRRPVAGDQQDKSQGSDHGPPTTDSRTQMRAGIFIGPEFGTVSRPDLVAAAREAADAGFDVLIACAFNYDAHSSEFDKLGRIPVLKARMNADLHMADDLKNTGKGNLFVIFGEPDITVTSGRWLVTGNGRMIANYEYVKELSGLGSLEEINRVGRDGLSAVGKVSGGGKIRVDLANSPGGGLGGGQYRRGSGAGGDQGILAVSGNREWIAGGNGDLSDSGAKTGISFRIGDQPDLESGGYRWSAAQRPQTLAALQSLSDADFPLSLTTDHWAQVTVHGVDVFHPNTGEVRSDGAEGIACWFIDTDYNEESFFVRHAYFLGANDPYKALKTTLKAEINEEAWATLNSDTSRPFDKPKSGRIAVKVINHLGDEVMKVFRV